MKKISGGKGGESMVEVKRREASGGEKWGAENFINGRGRAAEMQRSSVSRGGYMRRSHVTSQINFASGVQGPLRKHEITTDRRLTRSPPVRYT